MKSKLLALASAVMAFQSSFADPGPDDLPWDNIRLNLEGKTRTIRNWEWPGWSGFYLSVSNGTLAVTGRMSPKHGAIDLFDGGTLRFEPNSRYIPGAGDAQARHLNIKKGGTLELPRGTFSPFNASFQMEEGSLVRLGSDLNPVPYCHRWKVRGGRIQATDHVNFHMNEFIVEKGAVLELEVAKGKVVDATRIKLEEGASIKELGKGIVIRSYDDPRWAENFTRRTIDRMDLRARGDTANRCYSIYFAHEATSVVKRITYDCPEFGKISTHLPYCQVRYPEGCRKPFKIKAVIEAKDGTVVKKKIQVPFNPDPIGKPSENDKVYLGMVCYGLGRERYEMVTNDLANLYVRWGAFAQLLPENANSDIMPNWMEEAKKRDIRSMVIYGGPPEPQRKTIRGAWGERYLGINIGEKTGFFYGAANHMPGPKNGNLTEGRQWFLSNFFRKDLPPRTHGPSDEPFVFATSGAAFANYELPAGADYVCNELYAVGCQSLTYATAENRGAARKWGPEWWSGWLAHEWQTQATPYDHPSKYLSLEAGIKALYVMGTSLMCLESGSSGTQAHPYTWGVPEEHRKRGYTYDEDPPRRYRETIRKCHLFIKENPRAKGTPETKIALGLGCNDGYIGANTVPWAQHGTRAACTNGTINFWGPSFPELTWDRAREVFFPFVGTRGADGMPYGQVDVIGIDDQARMSDISRYSMIAFGGWNTMTERARRLLEKWMAKGGTCVLCLPQCSVRDDRDFVNYTPEDLMMPFGLEVEGFETVEGLEIARLAKDSKVEVIETIGPNKVPFVVRRPAGKGWLYLMLAKSYPGGIPRLCEPWKKLLADCASKVEQSMTIKQASPEDKLGYFIYAVYDDAAYLLNVDMFKPHKVIVTLDGKTEEIEVAPLEVKIFNRRK